MTLILELARARGPVESKYGKLIGKNKEVKLPKNTRMSTLREHLGRDLVASKNPGIQYYQIEVCRFEAAAGDRRPIWLISSFRKIRGPLGRCLVPLWAFLVFFFMPWIIFWSSIGQLEFCIVGPVLRSLFCPVGLAPFYAESTWKFLQLWFGWPI